ncbi:MAG: hypothetical protein Q8Q09_16910 [Deltaproteobacteria bacterium]|nr:hypothetical protein [Deltaproteobacteria bacterium]
MRTTLLGLVGLSLVSACSEPPPSPQDSGRNDSASGIDATTLPDANLADGAMDATNTGDSSDVVATGPVCMTNADCQGDTRCVTGRCAAWPEGQSDSMCATDLRPGVFAPTVQCQFNEAPMGDMFPNHTHVFGAVVVGDLAAGMRDPDQAPRPSIVAIFDSAMHLNPVSQTGILRVLDGRTCALQATLGEQALIASTSPAIADLDNDGLVEIVAIAAGGGLIAYKQSAPGVWRIGWRSTNAAGAPYAVAGGVWSAPSIVDLDDDGFGEVLRNGVVFNGRTGALIGGLGGSGGLSSYDARAAGGFGAHAVVMDVDEDNEPELVTGDRIYRWDRMTRDWVPETYRPAGGSVGHVGVANMGAFVSARFDAPETPEVVVISNGTARIETIEGRVVFGPQSIPGGFGGPPTIGDFDGDGLAEFATAGGAQYIVFDPDCTATPRPGGRCASMTTTGILWTRPSQDTSSAVTGSTTFDFEGDGRVEAVYADECFLRVYDGVNGDVLYSSPHASCTWNENPIVADVDGDFRAEIVMGSNHLCGTLGVGRPCAGLGPRNTDPIFAGLRCQGNTDCASGSCVEGLCRCTTDAQCCGAGACDFVCVAPPAGTAGAGNTCRASRERGPNGVRVLSDVMDRWVGSRPVWNEHTYHVTNIDDTLRIPRSSAVRRGWRLAGLNNFRTNVQGRAGVMGVPDATAASASYMCTPDNTAVLRARVCNRGAAPLLDSATVGFYNGEPGAMGSMRLCSAPMGRVVNPGACVNVECSWPGAATSTMPVDVRVRVDDDSAVRECHEQNNRTLLMRVVCPMIG